MNGSRAPEKILNWLLLAVAAVYFALLIFNTVTRTGRFSPDSINYVNVAKNILAGKGLTQPTLGFNQENFSLDAEPPVPFVDQAPLYPVMIAGVSAVGIPAARAALLLSAVLEALVFVLTFVLSAALYDKRVGLVSAGLLLFFHPMRAVQTYAMTETIAVALLLTAFWLLTIKALPAGPERSTANRCFIFMAGLCSGAAFATRYALIAFMVVGLFFLLWSAPNWPAKAINASVYGLGCAIPAGAVFLHNFIATGAFMPVHRARTVFRKNLDDTFSAMFGAYWGPPSKAQLIFFFLSIVVIGLVLIARREAIAAGREILVSRRRWLLPLWCATYFAFLVIQRSFSYFDVDARIILPAGIILLVLWSAAFLRAARLSIPQTQLLVAALFLIALAQQTQAAIVTPPLDFAKVVRSSERLTWIAEHTSPRDLIIGYDVVEVPFFFDRPSTFSFSPYPYTDPPTYPKVTSYVRRHCASYENIYIVIKAPPYPASEEQWRQYFGLFFADLVAGHEDHYDNVKRVADLKDGLIFRIDCR